MRNELALSTALAPMLPVDRPAPGLYVATGPGLLPAWFLSALCPALAHGARLFWVDAGNSFNAYGAGYAARALGCDPKAVLRRISLARPFNLFQLETMICRKLPAQWRGEPIVVADPFPMLYDEDVALKDARRVLSNVLRAMMELPAVWMILSVDRRPPRGREPWSRELLAQARGVAGLRALGETWALQAPH